jgi:hypothetical protein
MIKKAYLLLVHKNPEQVNYLLRQLILDGSADIYIHVNKLNLSIKGKLLTHKNIRILNECTEIYWGDFGITKAMLLLLRAAINSGIKYDFLSFKTGQDLIIKNGLDDFLSVNMSGIFMNVRTIVKSDDKYAHISIKWPKFTKRLYDGLQPARIIRLMLIKLYKLGINFAPNSNKLPDDYKLFNGKIWFTIPLNAARYIIDFVDGNSWYWEVFQNGLAPDELFFHTIIMNSRFAKDVVNDNLTYTNKGKNNHPPILTSKDIPAIINSNKYFARKFDASIDKNIVGYFLKCQK